MTDREQEARAEAQRVLANYEEDEYRRTSLTNALVHMGPLADALRALLAAHRPTEPEEDVVAELAKTYRPTPGDRDGMARARAALAALADPDEDNWEYQCRIISAEPGWEWRSCVADDSMCPKGSERSRRLRAGPWEPVTPRGEQP